mgnify:CR=1 FL=1
MKLSDAQRGEIEADVVTLCQELIRIPSVNYGEGKGDEKTAAEYVAKKLSEVGITSKLYESAPNRTSVVARIEGIEKSIASHSFAKVEDLNAIKEVVTKTYTVVEGLINTPSASVENKFSSVKRNEKVLELSNLLKSK